METLATAQLTKGTQLELSDEIARDLLHVLNMSSIGAFTDVAGEITSLIRLEKLIGSM